MTYRYVQARYDYGVRTGPTLGLMFHGAEANSGVVGYLSRDPARGVSANFVCERGTGRMVQMLPLDHASGSLNPADRSSNKAYFGHDHLVAVLGDWWTNPNAAVISVEIEMYAASGPDSAQVAGLTAWAADMVSHFPSIRGALGHADQTDTKPCPGTTTAMKSVFAAIGGHGLWGANDVRFIKSVPGYQIAVKAGTKFYLLDGADSGVTASKDMTLEVVGSPEGSFTNGAAVIVSTGILYSGDVRPTVLHVKQSNIVAAPAPVDDTPYSQADLDAAVAAAQSPASVTYPVTVGGKPAGSVTLP